MTFTPEQKRRIDQIVEGRVIRERRRFEHERERMQIQIAELIAENNRLQQQHERGFGVRLRRSLTWRI